VWLTERPGPGASPFQLVPPRVPRPERNGQVASTVNVVPLPQDRQVPGALVSRVYVETPRVVSWTRGR